MKPKPHSFIFIYAKDVGIGNQIQLIPVVKALAKAGHYVFSDSSLFYQLCPESICIGVSKIRDIGILPYNLGWRYALQAWKECRCVIGFPYLLLGYRFPLLSRCFISKVLRFEAIPEKENNQKFLDVLGIDSTLDFSLDIPYHPIKDTVALVPGGSYWGNCWRGWPELIGLLLAFGIKKIGLFGAEEDWKRGIIKRSGGFPPEVVSHRTPTIRDAAEEMVQYEFCIANDTGLMHLADILKIPTLAIFGPTDSVKNLSTFPNMVVQRKLPCMPCRTHRTPKALCSQIPQYKCMDIKPEKVFEAFGYLKQSMELIR